MNLSTYPSNPNSSKNFQYLRRSVEAYHLPSSVLCFLLWIVKHDFHAIIRIINKKYVNRYAKYLRNCWQSIVPKEEEEEEEED